MKRITLINKLPNHLREIIKSIESMLREVENEMNGGAIDDNQYDIFSQLLRQSVKSVIEEQR